MKADILETEYPMLCEGMRRQRGELALALLDYSKDNATSLQQVKECLLDRKRYRLEAQFNCNRRNSNNQRRSSKARGKTAGNKRGGFGQRGRRQVPYVTRMKVIHRHCFPATTTMTLFSEVASLSSSEDSCSCIVV